MVKRDHNGYVQFSLAPKKESCSVHDCGAPGLYIPVLIFRGPWCTIYCSQTDKICRAHDFPFQIDQVYCDDHMHRLGVKALLTDEVWKYCLAQIVIVTRGVAPVHSGTLLEWRTTGGLPIANLPVVKVSNP